MFSCRFFLKQFIFPCSLVDSLKTLLPSDLQPVNNLYPYFLFRSSLTLPAVEFDNVFIKHGIEFLRKDK